MLFFFLSVWGSAFSVMAGLVAFLICYSELAHHYVEKKKPLLEASKTGLFTFLFFMAVTLALAFGLPSLFT